jgi:hypothetical protein
MVHFVLKSGREGAAMARRGVRGYWPPLACVLLQAVLGDAGKHLLTKVASDKSLNSGAGQAAVSFSAAHFPRPGLSWARSRAPPLVHGQRMRSTPSPRNDRPLAVWAGR